jgi:hypothetical protein
MSACRLFAAERRGEQGDRDYLDTRFVDPGA